MEEEIYIVTAKGHRRKLDYWVLDECSIFKLIEDNKPKGKIGIVFEKETKGFGQRHQAFAGITKFPIYPDKLYWNYENRIRLYIANGYAELYKKTYSIF